MLRMARLLKPARLAVAAVALLGGATAQAAPITYYFTGSVGGSYGMDVPEGATFSGSFTYDPDLAKVDVAGDPATASYYGFLGKDAQGPAGALSVDVKFGDNLSYTTTDPTVRTVGVINGQRGIGEDPASPGLDSFRIQMHEADGSHFLLNLDDPTGLALDGTGLPSTLDFSKFNQPFVQFSKIGADGRTSASVYGTLTRISPEPVPEPTTLAVLGLGAAGLALSHRRRAGRKAASA